MCGRSGGACMVAGGHAWLLGGLYVVAPGGHAWDTMRYGHTVNERAVRILLECILVIFHSSFTVYYFLQDIKLLILDYAMICSTKVPWNLNLLQNKQWQIQDLPVGANPRGRASHAPPLDPLPLASEYVIGFVCNPEINCASRLSDDLSTRTDVNHRFRSFLNTHFLTFSNWQSSISSLWSSALSHAFQLSIIHTLLLINGSFPRSVTVNHPNPHSHWWLFPTLPDCQSSMPSLWLTALSHALQLSLIHTLTVIDGSFPHSPTVTHPYPHSYWLPDWANSTKTFSLTKVHLYQQ